MILGKTELKIEELHFLLNDDTAIFVNMLKKCSNSKKNTDIQNHAHSPQKKKKSQIYTFQFFFHAIPDKMRLCIE